MIYQITRLEDAWLDMLESSHYARRIKSHYAAYALKYDFSRLYSVVYDGNTVGVISIFNASMVISNMSGCVFSYDMINEIAQFININMPFSVELDPKYADLLADFISDMYTADNRTEFAFKSSGKIPELDVAECPSLDSVFNILKTSFPSIADSYELWITDTSHRVRRGLSQSFLMGDYTTATIQYIIDKTALIGHVATVPEQRGHFYARRLLYWIGERLTEDGFDVRLMARPHRVTYYEEIGFEAVGHDKVFELRKEYHLK